MPTSCRTGSQLRPSIAAIHFCYESRDRPSGLNAAHHALPVRAHIGDVSLSSPFQIWTGEEEPFDPTVQVATHLPWG